MPTVLLCSNNWFVSYENVIFNFFVLSYVWVQKGLQVLLYYYYTIADLGRVMTWPARNRLSLSV